mmetsp:Transcript_632/g.1142  ORF Transcript_632/g.1142 Transcript_632/m.1142 type:complete len:1749 (+) Transcript_632:55-5301(+)
MASSEEFNVRRLLKTAANFWENQDSDSTYVQQALQCVDEADSLVRRHLERLLKVFSLQSLVLFAETVLDIPPRFTLASYYIGLYYERTQETDQFFVRAQLVSSQLQASEVNVRDLKGQAAIEQTRVAYTHIQKAIEVVTKPENKLKYMFLYYNITVTAWRILRPLVKPGYCRSFIDCFERLALLLDECDDPDVGWRARILQGLVSCYLDAERKPEAQKTCDKLWDLTKRKGVVPFQEVLWRLKVHVVRDNAGAVGSIRKEAETTKSDLKFFVSFQQLRSAGIAEAQVERELTAQLQMNPSSEGLAEASRVALQYNLFTIAKNCMNSLMSHRNPALRARIWAEYTKAELLAREAGDAFDMATGMKLTPIQLKKQELGRRIEALKILERVMMAAKRLDDAGVTTEGCVLIWNIGKPLLTSKHQHHTYQSFLTACMLLESLDSPLHELRIVLHLELAKQEMQLDFISKAEAQIAKAFKLDSTALQAVMQMTNDDDPGDFLRPYDRYLRFMRTKLRLKREVYKEPEKLYEQGLVELEQARSLPAKRREARLKVALEKLMNEPSALPADATQLEKYERRREFKTRCALLGELADLAFEAELDEIAEIAAMYCLTQTWDPVKEVELVVSQAQCCLIMSQVCADKLFELDLEAGFIDLVKIDDDPNADIQPDPRLTDLAPQISEWKRRALTWLTNGLTKATSVNQTWLCFNAGIIFWNLYLPSIRAVHFERFVLREMVDCLRLLVTTMNNILEKQVFVLTPNTQMPINKPVDFHLPAKLQVFTELVVVLMKLLVNQQLNEEALKIAESALLKPIPANQRKEIEAMRGKVQAMKGAAKAPGKTELITAEVINLMEAAGVYASDAAKKNLAVDSLKRAQTLLLTWKPDELSEAELTLHAELWTKISRQIFSTGALPKLALVCVQHAFDFAAKGLVEQKRKRWFSLAEFVYGEVLSSLVDEKRQELSSRERLVLAALEHFFKAAELGVAADLNDQVIEAAKAMFNASLKLPPTPSLTPPLVRMVDLLILKNERDDPDFLLVFFRSIVEAFTVGEKWAEGERIVEKAFNIVPATHQKLLWEAQMLFLTKQRKNVTSYLTRLKESNPLLQAKVWVKLARSAADPAEVETAYTKAMDLLRDHIECSEIMIEWATWQHSRGFDVADILRQAAELMLELEEDLPEFSQLLPRSSSSSQVSFGSRLSAARSRKQRAPSKAPSVASRQSSQSSKRTRRSASNRSQKSKRSQKSSVNSKISKLNEEVESCPDSLNVTHYERLMRINIMLAELAPTLERRKSAGLAAFYFMKRMMKLSFGEACPETTQEWLGFSTSQDQLNTLKNCDERTLISYIAFEKPKTTHSLALKLLDWFDTDFSLHIQCVPLLEFLYIFSEVVLQSPTQGKIYRSWKARVLTKLGKPSDAVELTVDNGLESNLAYNLGEELYRRENWLLSEAALNCSTNPKAYSLQACLAARKNDLRAAISLDMKALSCKDLEILMYTLVPTTDHLLAANKVDDVKELIDSTLATLQTCTTTNLLTKRQLEAKLNFLRGNLALDEISQSKTKEIKKKAKADFIQSLEEVQKSISQDGCTTRLLKRILKLYVLWIKLTEEKLLISLSKRKVKSRVDQLNTQRNLLTKLFSVYMGVLDQLEDFKAEGSQLLAELKLNLAYIDVLEEALRLKVEEKNRQLESDETVVTRYLDQLEREIEENRDSVLTHEKRRERITSLLDAAIQMVPPGHSLLQTIQTVRAKLAQVIAPPAEVAS